MNQQDQIGMIITGNIQWVRSIFIIIILIEPNDFEEKDFEIVENNQRSYGNDESILIYEHGTNQFVSEIFDSLKVYYDQPNARSFCSLQSALTDGCDYAHMGDTISFSGIPHLQKEETTFILPLINSNEAQTHNIIPETI